MVTLTDKAKQELDAYFAGKDAGSIRIYLSSGGWRGPQLMLALDEPSEADQVITENGYTFCIEKELVEKVGTITIDFTYMGFSVEPANSLGGGASCSVGGCGGSCSQ